MTQTNDLFASPKTKTYTATWVSANAIKTSVATAITAQSYSGAGLNGAIGAADVSIPQEFTATTSSHAASYVITSPIVITYLDYHLVQQTASLYLTQVNGNETVTAAISARQIVQIDVPPMADALGAFTFGLGDVRLPNLEPLRQVRVGSEGTIKVMFQDGSTDTIPALAGEKHDVLAMKVFATGTTFTSPGVTLFA